MHFVQERRLVAPVSRPLQGTVHWDVRRRMLVACAVVASVLVVDQLSKWAVVSTWAPGDGTDLIGGARLVHAVNTGVAFNIGRGRSAIVAPIVMLTAALAWVARRELRRSPTDPAAPTPVAVLAFGLIVGGAVGNVIDRLVRSPGWGRGGVVDFVDLRFWPVFNVADSALTVGVVLMAISLFRQSRVSAPAVHP